MADTDRELKILLKLVADAGGAEVIKGQLKQIEAQGVKTAEVINAAATPMASIQAQLAAAGAAFDPVTRTFKSITTEAQGSAAASLLMGVNLGKARQEAIVLFREIAAGNIRASTLSSLLGSLGTTLAIGGIAAYELFQIISHAADKTKEFTSEYAKQTNELSKQVAEWTQLAKKASDFGDVANLADKIGPQLTAAHEKFDEFKNKEISTWDSIKDYISTHELIFINPIAGFVKLGESAEEARDRIIKAMEALNQQRLKDANIDIDTAQRSMAVWDAIQAKSLPEGIADQALVVAQLKEKLAGIDRTKSDADFIAWSKVNDQLQLAEKHLDTLRSSEDKLTTSADKLSEQIKQADFKNLDPDDRLAAYTTDIDTIHAKLRDLGVDAASPLEALGKRNQLDKEDQQELIVILQLWARLLGLIAQTNQEKENDTAKALNKQISADLREQATLLQSIRERQQLIQQDPFISADAKAALLLNSYLTEQARLLLEIAKIRADIALVEAARNDPKKVADLNEKLQQTNFVLDGLKLKIATLNQPLTAELANWVNSFGTAAHQIAGLIEGSINAALQGTNQLLLDAVFRTGDWRQTLMGVERQILNLFLTWIENMALQQAASLLGITTTATAQGVAMGGVAGAAAPAAAAVSIATEGEGAIVGEIAAVVAIAAIIAALAGAFKEGGLTGTNQIARVGEEGPEFVFTHRATKNIGAENLYAMMHAAENAPHFGIGGRMYNWGGNILPPNIYPGTTFGPSGSRTGYQGPTANTDWFARYGARFAPDAGNARPPIYPSLGNLDNDIPPANPFDPYYVAPFAPVVVQHGNPPVLPSGPGGLNEGPGLFPGPRGGIVIDTSGGAPRYVASPNYNFGGNLGLGSNLLSSLILLGFGTNRYVPGGTISSTYSGPALSPDLLNIPEVTFAPSVTPGSFIPGPNRIDPGFIDPATGLSLATSGTVIGHDTVTGAPIVRGAGGQVYVLSGAAPYGDINSRFGPGSGAWNADQFTKAYLLGGGDPGGPNTMTVGDAGRTIFRSGLGHFDPETEKLSVVRATNLPGALHPDPHWVFPSQSESAARGLSFDAQKYNAWLIAHNSWYYDALGHHADGARIPGAPSHTDSMLAWLAPGEHVIDAFTAAKYDKFFGGQHWATDLLENMRFAVPHFASGGRTTGSQRAESGSSTRSIEDKIEVHIYDNRRAAERGFQESPAGRKIFREHLARYS